MKMGQNRQKGAVAVIFALAIPILLVFTGLAVDFGNAYFHRQQLQNMADAAVLAAADKYSKTSSEADAQTTAQKYIDDMKSINGNRGYENPTARGSSYPIITSKDGIIKLKLVLDDTVPTYFIKILKLFNNGGQYDSMPIAVTAVAKITGSSLFDGLITYKHEMQVTQGYQNGNNQTTFDGKLYYAGPDPDSAKSENYNATGQNDNNSKNIYSSPGGFVSSDQLKTNTPVPGEMPKLDGTPYAFDTLKQRAESADQTITNEQTVYTDDLTGNIISINSPNIDIIIDKALIGSDDPALKNKPIFIIYGKSENETGTINLHVNHDTVRPLIIYYMGTTFHYNPGPGSPELRGVIYAPNADVLVNENAAKFHGSIYCNNFSSQVQGSYTGPDSNDTFTGSGTARLVDDDD